MRKSLIALLAVATLTVTTAPAFALQCVPYARAASGVSLRGDAWTWWAGANGAYDKGTAPSEGAVMVFKKTASMRHGHVAVVTKIVNKRTVLVDHANWAPRRGGGRGKVTEDAAVMDVSPRNDWSQLRVWYGPIKNFGNKVYPAYGFIYPKKGTASGVMQASYSPAADAADAFAAANGNYDPFNDSNEATSAATAPQVQPVTSASLPELTVVPEAPKAEAAPQQQQTMAVPEPVTVEAPKAVETPKIVEAAKIEAAPVAPKTEALPVTPVVAAKAEAKTEEAAKPSKAAKPQHAKTQKHVKMDVAVQVEIAPIAAEPAQAEAAAEQWDGDALAAKLAGSGSYGGRSGS